MPASNGSFWTERIGRPHPCHYEDRWLDGYAFRIRRAAVRRLIPRGIGWEFVDVGCGDGEFTAWLSDHLQAPALGVDPYHWPGVEERMSRFAQGDGEWLADLIDPLEVMQAKDGLSKYPLATFVTSLPFMSNWQRALASAEAVADRILVVENLQTPTPDWQRGIPGKTPIELLELLYQLEDLGFKRQRVIAANVLDRRWFPGVSPLPRWTTPAVAVVTYLLDRVIAPLVDPRQARYCGVLAQR